MGKEKPRTYKTGPRHPSSLIDVRGTKEDFLKLARNKITDELHLLEGIKAQFRQCLTPNP